MSFPAALRSRARTRTLRAAYAVAPTAHILDCLSAAGLPLISRKGRNRPFWHSINATSPPIPNPIEKTYIFKPETILASNTNPSRHLTKLLLSRSIMNLDFE